MESEPFYTREDQLIDMAAANDGKIAIETASSFVEVIGYDMRTHVCIVTIRGKEYIKKNISFETFVKFVNANSKGVFWNDVLRYK